MLGNKLNLLLLSLIAIVFLIISPEVNLADDNVTNSTENLKNIQIPVEQEATISGMDENGIRIGFVNVGPFAGWDYAYIRENDASNKFVFEKGSTNRTFKIRAASPNWGGFDYFNISRRGYIYLDRKENAREFTIQNQQAGNFKLIDANTGQEVGIYRWGRYDYLTIGPGTKIAFWLTF